MSTTRRIVARLVSLVLTVVTVPLWFMAYAYVCGFSHERTNTAALYMYTRFVLLFAIPHGLIVALIVAPLFSFLIPKRFGRWLVLLISTFVFWTGFVCFNAGGDYALRNDIVPADVLMPYTICLFLLPPVYFGCCGYVVTAHRRHTEKAAGKHVTLSTATNNAMHPSRGSAVS